VAFRLEPAGAEKNDNQRDWNLTQEQRAQSLPRR
jgi:hypothetical protein